MRVDGAVLTAIDRGLLVLLGVASGDAEAEADRLAGKVARLRVFENDEGKFDLSLLDTGGEALVVSQFHADRGHGEGEQAELRGRRGARAGRATV